MLTKPHELHGHGALSPARELLQPIHVGQDDLANKITAS